MRASNCVSSTAGFLVQPVELLQEIELPPLFLAADFLVADVLDQLLDFDVLRVEVRALVDARQEPGLPVLRFLDRIPARTHGDESRQILVLGPQAVDQPGTEAGPNQPRVAAVHQEQRRLVVGHVGVH